MRLTFDGVAALAFGVAAEAGKIENEAKDNGPISARKTTSEAARPPSPSTPAS